MQVLIKRAGIFCEMCRADGAALPQEIVDYIGGHLVYTFKEMLRGAEAYRSGSRQVMRFERRRLYQISPSGALQTSVGMMPRILKLLSARGVSYSILNLSPVNRPQFAPDWQAFSKFNGTWRYRQEELARMLLDPELPGGVVVGPPALGKSEIISRISYCLPHARIAVITKRRDVAVGLYRRIIAHVANVGFVGDGKSNIQRVTVCIAKSMHKLSSDIDIVFFDEAHEMVSDSFCSTILLYFPNSKLFGLTATPAGRKDGMDIRVEYMFGPTIFHMGWPEAVANGLVAPIRVRWLHQNWGYNPCALYKNDNSRLRHGIWLNNQRNAAFAWAARQHQDEQVLALVSTLEHAAALQRHLPDFELCYGEADSERIQELKSQGLLQPEHVPVNTDKREKMRQQFEAGVLRKVIATDVWSTGVSFDALSVLLRLDARDSATMDEQGPGRVCRVYSGKTEGIVYDSPDTFDAGFTKKANGRRKRYRSKGWEQEAVQVSDNV